MQQATVTKLYKMYNVLSDIEKALFLKAIKSDINNSLYTMMDEFGAVATRAGISGQVVVDEVEAVRAERYAQKTNSR